GQTMRGQEVVQHALRLWDEAARDQPDNPHVHFFRGMTLSYLGQKEEAIAENKKAIALAGNLSTRNQMKHGLAETYSVTGETQAALDLIEELLHAPTSIPVTRYDLRYAPWWKPLRSEPRFRELMR